MAIRPKRRNSCSLTRGALPNRARGGIFAKLLFLIFLLFLLGIAYLAREPILRSVGRWWVVSEEPEKVQVIAVLGGDNAYGERVRKAVELYRAGWGEWLLLSGAVVRSYLPEVELMKREAIAQGVPAERLLTLSSGAAATMEETQHIKAVLTRHGWKRVLLVTSNYHARRVRIIARKIFGEVGIAFRVVAAPDSEFPSDRWWRTRIGQRHLWLETQKVVWTYFEFALGKH